MSTIVVTPSVRNTPLRGYFAPAIKFDCPIFVVDDSGGTADRSAIENHRNFIIGTDAFVESLFPGGKRPWVVPWRNPSCKNAGLFYAWKEKFDTVILLDDDCAMTKTYMGDIPVGKKVTAHQQQGMWVNTLTALGRPDLYSRGFPYELRSDMDRPLFEGTQEVAPMFNMGLWTNEPDINGIDKIKDHLNSFDDRPWMIPDDVQLATPYTLVKVGQNLPLSIMNCQLSTELIPAFWQPPDYAVANGFRIRRHDDVWSMYVLKKVMDILEMPVTFGLPLIKHMKEGNMLAEAVSENVTNLLQYHFTRVVDSAVGELSQVPAVYLDTPAHVAINLSRRMRKTWVMKLDHTGGVPGTFKTIIKEYALGLEEWASMFLQPGDPYLRDGSG